MGFWSSIVDRFSGGRGSLPAGGILRPGGSAEAGGGPSALLRRRREDPALEQLRDGYAQVVDLVGSIKRHQEVQDARAGEVAASLAQVAGTLSDIQTSARSQSDTLGRIAEELQTVNRRAVDWEQTLAELPPLIDGQREVLSAVSRQIAAAEKRDGELAASLTSFRDAVTTLGDATTASSVALKDLQRATLDSEERTASLLREQNKRFIMLFWVTVALAVVAATTGILAFWRSGG